MLTLRFKPKRIPGFSKRLVIGTSRMKYKDPKQTKATIYSFRGATLADSTRTLQQHRPNKIRTVAVIAGFNYHDTSANGFLNNWRKLITTVIEEIHPRFIFVQKTTGSINNQIKNLNYSLYKLIISFIHPITKIIPPYINLPFNHLCKDGVHFSFYGSHMFACYLTRIFEFFTSFLIIWFQTTDSLPYLYLIPMTEQSHCKKCSKYVRGVGVWYYSCSIYQHVKCSGFWARRVHHENFRCVSCETKKILISSEATILSHVTAKRQTRQASRVSCPEPCGYWLKLEESKIAFEKDPQRSCSLESNLLHSARKQDRQ